jgi:hypothetical protein
MPLTFADVLSPPRLAAGADATPCFDIFDMPATERMAMCLATTRAVDAG